MMIDWAELRRRGWDDDAQLFVPDSADLVFGAPWCAAVNCDQVVHHPGLGLCRRCQGLWVRAGKSLSFEEFCQTALARIKARGGGLCLVCRTPGHERPVREHGLCSTCAAAARDRDQTVAAYIAGDDQFPPAAPRPTFGRCIAGPSSADHSRAQRRQVRAGTAVGQDPLPAGGRVGRPDGHIGRADRVFGGAWGDLGHHEHTRRGGGGLRVGPRRWRARLRSRDPPVVVLASNQALRARLTRLSTLPCRAPARRRRTATRTAPQTRHMCPLSTQAECLKTPARGAFSAFSRGHSLWSGGPTFRSVARSQVWVSSSF